MNDAESLGNGTGLEIAVIGMAGRFPGAEDIDEFWRNLCGGVESLRNLTPEELAKVPVEMRRSPFYVPVTGMIRDHEEFDAAFFGINPREADVMDPQQRLFLECSWAALEHAGYDPERCPGAVGVWAGARMNFYLWNVYSNPAVVRAAGDLLSQIANEKDYVATRVSYKLNLSGPSVTVQSACSTSLVAVHLACQGLLSGECDMALAGGVSVRVPEIGYLATDADVNSPDGHLRSFDAKAGGTIFTSGLGAVVLKRLADAIADGDTIHAVIKGSAVTNDGSQKVGFTAPGVDGQVRVLRTALTVAEVDPREISYLEAHGTGTPVGDPIEISALTKVYREKTDERGFCALGTVKTNIGHLGAAAGVAGLIKTVMALERRQIPPSINFEKPNPQIDFESSPFFVNTELRDWEANGSPRRAGVSAFGMGGTNAHVILEEAPEMQPATGSRPWQLLLLSARTETALGTLTSNLAAHLESRPEDSLADIAYTLQVGRKVHEHRRAVVCRDAGHAREVLAQLPAEWASTGFASGRERGAAFLFSGQGAQYVGMGRGLYETEATFREQVDLCCETLRPHLGLDLRELLFAADDDAEAAEKLGQTRFTQPALFVVEYALARLWMEWGITPKAMLGHSIGEYVAACLAGVFSLEDALALVAERGRLMQSLPSGAMLAVPLREEEVAPLLGSQLSLAAVNAPDRCVVAGPHEAVEALRAELASRGVGARPLHTSHAFHSAMMEPILAPFLQRFAGIELHAPQIPYLSNVTGTWITEAEATDPGYWARHLRQGVRFADGIRELCKDPGLVLLEVGPGQTLATLARQHPDRGAGRVVLSSLRHPKDRQEDLPLLLKTLGQLWLTAVEPDWSGFYARESRRRIPLPTYPFERRRFWIEPGDFASGLGGFGSEAQKKEDVADWFYLPYWKPSVPPAGPEDAIAGRWLVFLDTAGVGEQAAARVKEAGGSVVEVLAADAFRKVAENRYEIAPGRREDYDALVKDLVATGKVPDRILHLWNTGPADMDLASLERAPELSFWSLLFLAQSLGRNNVTQPMRITVVSSHMQRVAGESRLVPERALLLGPSKIIPLEYAQLRCASVDVELPVSDAMIGRLLTEATAPESSREGVIAYRSGRRWVQSYESVRLEASSVRSTPLRDRGVYLITGGLGGLGLTFAEFLAREHRARLVLLGISALPERETWDEWLQTHGEADRISQRIRKLRELEAMGAEVLVVSADVADREQMRAAVQQGVDRFGELHGVIHAAGLAGGGMIQLKTAEVAGRVLSPKVAGTRALLDALDGLAIEFLALCSSTIAVAGGLGQVDYCAANNFLDALAYDMAIAGGPRTVSINWGAWEEVGMAVAAGITGRSSSSQAYTAKPAEDIHPLLDYCVSEFADQTIYATNFSASRHWVLDEHRIMDIPTLPGTTYLELGRAAFLHHAAAFEGYSPDGGVELRDVFFLSPLLLPEEEREVRVFLEKDGDSFNYRVTSRMEAPSGRGEPTWQPHARGKVMALAPGQPERLDPAALLARCEGEVMEINGPVMGEGEALVYWGAHWQSLKRIHVGGGGALARIELPEEFVEEAVRYGLHPALLDVATGIAGFFEKDTYLPLSYKQVKVYGCLPRCFYSYLRKHGDASASGETLAVDVTILGDDGEVIVDIEQFTMKKVNDSASTLRRPAAAPAAAEKEPVAAAEATASAAAPQAASHIDVGGSGGILPHEGVEALRRALSRDADAPQVVVTAKDLHAMIEQVNAVNRGNLLDAASFGSQPATVHARPNIPTPYVAPLTENERRLAVIWQTTLGIEQVGVNDNFFDLGGDSILGIQVIARASDAGFQLSPDQLFEHQTIAELAKLFEDVGMEEAAAAQPVPVTPYQRELLTASSAAACWYAAWPLPAEAPADLEREIVRGALREIVKRHETLRTRFTLGVEGWMQLPGEVPEDLAVREMSLSGAVTAMDLARDLRAGLDPERGLLAAAAVLSGEGDEPKQALFVVHPLAADGPSWVLLREELRTACGQLSAEQEVSLPPVTASYFRWLATTGEWGKGTGAITVPAGLETVSVRLESEETRALLEEVPELQRMRVEEVVLAALAKTVARSTGAMPTPVLVDTDLRETTALDLDLSRTVGCFAVSLTVAFDLGVAADPGEELRLAKEQLRGALGAGAVGLEPLASFAYLGDAQAVVGLEPAIRTALAVTGQLDGGELRFDWRTGENTLFAVPVMAAEFLEELRSLISFCLSPAVAVYTPSDFPDADLNQEDLDKLFS